MPELPEVETVARGVGACADGETIIAVETGSKPQTFKSLPALLAETLTGARIDQVHRVGKAIAFDLTRKTSNGKKSFAQFMVHLGMTGRLLVSSPGAPRAAHTHAILTLSNGQEVRFVDPRRFGRLWVLDHPYIGPGREPLTIPLDEFIALFRNRKTSIKAALLNQSLLHGVGNIYADEALFRAGIRPRRRAGRLTREELSRLRTSLIKVLRAAIKLGGSSVSDYVDAAGSIGFFQLHHKVYQRTGQSCRSCGAAIQRIVLAGRSTHFCPVCQK